jgi:hypothetical protein
MHAELALPHKRRNDRDAKRAMLGLSAGFHARKRLSQFEGIYLKLRPDKDFERDFGQTKILSETSAR